MTTGIQIAARLRELADTIDGASDAIDAEDLDITPLERAVDRVSDELLDAAINELSEELQTLQTEDDDEGDEDEEDEVA